MEYKWNSSLQDLPRDEQDFPWGAKATSSLPPATELNLDYDSFELPDWMESREILGLPAPVLEGHGMLNHPDNSLFNVVAVPEKMELDDHEDPFTLTIKPESYHAYFEQEDSYMQTIKPEDMLVPLSELQPEKYPSKPLKAEIPLSASPITLVPIQVQKVKMSPEQKGQSLGSIAIQLPEQPQTSGYQSLGVQPIDELSTCNADELLNELVDLANKEPNRLTNLITSFDSTVVQAGMDDLLLQLESSTSNKREINDTSEQEVASTVNWTTETFMPVSYPSPVPSVGSLSPQSNADSSFLQSSPLYITEVRPKSKENCEETPLSSENSYYTVQSPSECTLVYSPGSSITESPADDEESESDCNKMEMHSYSLSPRKTKAGRRGAASRTSKYPEGRKERKKEQNKQAALRYRQKKKQEEDDFMSVITREEERQKSLKEKYSGLKQELSYLKKIFREVLIAKGTHSEEDFKRK